MDIKYFCTILCCLLLSKCNAIRVGPCPTNKIAPYEKAEWRTLGYFFGSRPTSEPLGSPVDQQPNCDPPNPNDDPNLTIIDGDNQQGTDYDPVTSEENDTQPPKKPGQSQRPQQSSGLWNWFPSIITEDHWPSRPPRPPAPPPPSNPNNGWFWGWFGSQGGYKPPKPTKPPFYDDATKPVHEYIEDETVHVPWKPGSVVGGPNNNIVPLIQDLSNWSTVPTPRPTRPFIPGQRSKYPRRSNEGIIGSFIDLFSKKR